MSNNKQEKLKEIADLLKKAEDTIKEAEKIANEHKLSFSWDLSYGMGGHFVGAGQEAYANYETIKAEDNTEGIWCPSSSSC